MRGHGVYPSTFALAITTLVLAAPLARRIDGDRHYLSGRWYPCSKRKLCGLLFYICYTGRPVCVSFLSSPAYPPFSPWCRRYPNIYGSDTPSGLRRQEISTLPMMSLTSRTNSAGPTAWAHSTRFVCTNKKRVNVRNFAILQCEERCTVFSVYWANTQRVERSISEK